MFKIPMDSPETVLLSLLLEDPARFYSGSALAQALGVSRVSVWGYFEKLRAEGFLFEAVRNRGYRLTDEPDHVHGGLLSVYLKRLGCAVPVVCLAETGSTNTDARKRLLDGEKAPFFLTAVRQTAGRGRLGRAWFGEDVGNLYLTFGLRPQVPPARLSGFTLWLGFCLCRHLADYCKTPLRIKWPNDLVCEGRKLAGILTEMHSESDTVQGLAFGIGLNINGTFTSAPETVRAIAGSLRASAGRSFSVNAVAAETMACLARAADAFFASDAWRDELFAQWPAFDALAGKSITLRGLDQTIRTATALGLAEDGGLRVRFADGQISVVQAGDVTLSGAPLPS